MVNNSISVVLTKSCCERNYLMKIVIGRSIYFRGRKYCFKETTSEVRYDLYCNGWCIGDLYIDEVIIYKERAPFIKSEDLLKSLLAMFNLFPC